MYPRVFRICIAPRWNSGPRSSVTWPGLAAPCTGIGQETAMTNRTLTVVAAVILGLAALFVARPYIDYQLYAATAPRPSQ